jgi:hypothetical protein
LREPFLQALELIGLRPETHMVHVLLLAFDQDHLVLIAALAAHHDALVELAGFHPEIGVELLADRRIRHGKSDVLQRTNRHGPLRTDIACRANCTAWPGTLRLPRRAVIGHHGGSRGRHRST